MLKTMYIVPPEGLNTVPWERVQHGSIYLDIWGGIHYELNNKGFYPFFHNTNPWDLLFRQERIYSRLPFRCLARCKSRPMSDLIGVRQFIYYRGGKMLIPSTAILPWKFMEERGDVKRNPHVGEIRRLAFYGLFEALDVIAPMLGAKISFSMTSTAADEKMQECGYEPYELKTWREKIFKYAITFPLWNQRVYVKLYE